jgi:hypothetical protein
VAPAEWPDNKFIYVKMTVGQYRKVFTQLTGCVALVKAHDWHKKEDHGMWELWECPKCGVVKACELMKQETTYYFDKVADHNIGIVDEVRCE